MSPTQFQEEYALNPAERPQLVKATTPGTEEHHLYHLRYLSQQLQTGELPITPQTIADATALFDSAEKSGVCHDYEQLEQLRNQIALLAFPVKPDILRKVLPYDSSMAGVEQGENDPEGVSEDDDDDDAQSTDAVSKLPVALDQTLLDIEVLTEKLLDEIESNIYSVNFSRDAWPHLLAQPRMETILDNLDPDQLCHLLGMDFLYSSKSLEILGKADTSRLDQVIVKVILRLYQEKKVDFSQSNLGFDSLTWSQLMTIKKEQPQIMNDEAFVGLLEKRIIPQPFPEKEEVAQEDWLSRMRAFVDELSPKFNRHKLAVYVAIPRNHPQYNKKTLDTVEHDLQVNLYNYQSLNYWSGRVSVPTSARDDEVIKECLSRFMLEKRSADEYEHLFEVKTFLNPLLARVMLMSGDKDVTTWSGLLSSHESITQLAEQTILKFAPGNPTKFLPTDNVVFKLRAKNAKRILVRVFEVKTFEYLQQYGDSVMGKNLNLDGLTPNWEHHLVLDRPPMEMHDVVIELPELVNRRGAFVMDVISNGENSCAYFTKGCLDFVERQSVAGHVLTILDESQAVLSEKCSVWLNGYYYKPNGDGDIIVPYRKPSSSSSSSIYLIHDGFTTRRAFEHRVEEYSIQLACHIDHESIVVGATAKVLIKSTVLIAGNAVICPVSLLEQVQLTIQSDDTNAISTTNTVSDFKIHDVDWSEYNIQVPANLAAIRVIFAAKIKVISTGEYQDLRVSRDFSFESPTPDQSVYFMNSHGIWDNKRVSGEIVSLLRKRHDGYRILVLGKNGEPRSNTPLEFKINHLAPVEPLEIHLRTDDHGEIFLGPLQDIDAVLCKTTGITWRISENDACVYPKDIHSVVGEVVSLPLARQDTITIRQVALHSVAGSGGFERCVLEDCTSNIRLENGLLTIKGLHAGYYSFRIGSTVSCRLVIAPARDAKARKITGLEDYLLGSDPMLELLDCTKAPLHMAKPAINAQEQTVDIQLYNWTLDTRLCVVATKFLPIDGTVFKKLKVLDAEVPWAMEKTRLTLTSFKAGRVLGEEYQYILNRKTRSTHWAGNLLTKPSALLSPWNIADTAMSEQRMMDSHVVNEIETCAVPMSAMQRWTPRNMKTTARRSTGSAQKPPLLNFFAHPSVVLVNLKPDSATGLVRLPLSTFQESTFIQVFAADGHQAVQRSTVLPQHPAEGLGFKKRDLRFKSALDHTKHYIGERTGIDLDLKLQPGVSENAPASIREATITLASNMSAPSLVRVVNSVSQVYDLMLTLLDSEADKENLRKFSFIKDWHRLSTEAKKEKYSKWNCHELNLFLYKKDRAFFDAAVSPFLKNKMLKSFLDEYFVGASLEKYVALDQFSMLTSMEKCLLAQRIPGLRPAVVRWIKDRARNARAASNVKLFNTVMNSGNLKESTSGGGGGRGGEGAGSDKAVVCAPAALAYSPTSPSYSPTSPAAGEMSASYEIVEDLPPAAGAARSAPTRMLLDSDGDNDMYNTIGLSKKKKTAFTMQRAMAERTLQSRFKPLDLTKEMAETYYYSREDIVEHDDQSVNLFWLDLVQWDDSKGTSFLSQNFIANAGSFTDAMATIALLDVAFRPKEAVLNRASDQSLVVSTLSPAVVFHSSTKELAEAPAAGSVLVTQQYFDQTDKEEYDEVRMTHIRKYIQPGAEFRPLESYGAHVVLMNATPNPMRVHLEVQIPQGAISIYNGLEAGQDIQLQSHGTFQYEYGFYFPEQGDFPHYPAHVSNYEDIVAYAPASVLKVRTLEPNHKDLDAVTSWSNVVKHGSKSDILSKLESSPLSSIPEDLLYSRLIKDKKFLQQVTSILRSRQEFSERIWSAALLTQSCELVQELLMHKATVDLDVGYWFTSSTFVRQPQARSTGVSDQSFRYLEYFPLINARAHKATRNATILNDKFKDQYDRFLRLLTQKPHHDVDDLLMLIVYLLAQDRILEAKERFQQLSEMMHKAEGSGQQGFFQQLQYDYLWAYLSLCVEVQADSSTSGLGLDLAGVQKILDKYREYPVERWSKMFKDMQQYVDEIELSMTASTAPAVGSTEGVAMEEVEQEPEDEAVEEGGAEVPVSVDFKIGSESVVAIRHRGVREVTVEYYSIDAETMFSGSPLTFSDQGESDSSNGGSGSQGGRNSDDSSHSYRLVKPNGVDTHVVKRAVRDEGILMIPILAQYLNTNVMISVTSSPPAATRSWKAYYSQTILLQCLEQTGTVKVVSKSDGRPIRGGYVKVYAEMKPGSGETTTTTMFWKDGYTDLVGRFAYAQVSTAAVAAADAGGSLSSSGKSTKSALENVKRFAVFVDGGREGCVVKSLPVPPV
ncbi:hypothetical protein BGZ75_002268 [Mortierella antarctica]|nr:hypothetical protein BGZ75_002268 [Mortierella antarctica]